MMGKACAFDMTGVRGTCTTGARAALRIYSSSSGTCHFGGLFNTNGRLLLATINGNASRGNGCVVFGIPSRTADLAFNDRKRVDMHSMTR